MLKRLRSLSKKILNKNHLLTLSTSSKNIPWSNTAFYVFDKNFNIYIWSEENTRHSNNLKKNKKVAINIFDSRQEWGSLLEGLQMIGVARKIPKKDILKVGWLYFKRFPKAIKVVGNPEKFHEKIFDSKLYKIKPLKIKVLCEKTLAREFQKD